MRKIAIITLIAISFASMAQEWKHENKGISSFLWSIEKQAVDTGYIYSIIATSGNFRLDGNILKYAECEVINPIIVSVCNDGTTKYGADSVSISLEADELLRHFSTDKGCIFKIKYADLY